jgi:tetratricopeptide (TPR) repeat protein
LEKNPEDTDAMHVLVISIDYDAVVDDSGAVDEGATFIMANKCITLQPRVPEFHVTLGRMHAAINKDTRNAIRCYDRALELEWNPEVVYYKGLIMADNEREAIELLQQYVEVSEKDEPNVPHACFVVAYIYLVYFGDEEHAEEYLKKGEELEKYSIKLPSGELHALEMRKYKDSVQQYYRRKAAAAVATSGGSTDAGGLKCGECGKSSTTLSKCGRCQKTRYCGHECQKKHWPIHKKFCGKN